MQTKYTLKEVQKFWGKIDKQSSMIFYNGSRCWEWIGGHVPGGYGCVWMGEKDQRTHRVSYELAYGEIPLGLHVLHHCDNPPCCNPEHLFLGTQQDNMNDKKRKNRHADYRGELHPGHKLTDEQIAEIRRRYAWYGIGGETSTALAKEFGVTKTHIQRIVSNKIRS